MQGTECPEQVSNSMMAFSRKRYLVVALPFFALIGLYLFLVGANYYYAGRAAYLLHRIRELRLDDSAITELRGLGSEHGFRYEKATNCSISPCMYMVVTNNEWMWLDLK